MVKIYSIESKSVVYHNDCLMLVSAESEEDAYEIATTKTDVEDSIGEIIVREIKGITLAPNVNYVIKIFADDICFIE